MDKSLFKTGEFWQSGQRRAHTLHEISYRGCFKPELARFFTEKFTKPGDVVFDPFMGRGTTLLEAALLGRKAGGVDANPLGEMLIRPRLNPPKISHIEKRLSEIPWVASSPTKEDLLAFYHPQSLEKITALRDYLLQRESENQLDIVDSWIRLVALSRLSGHSEGFFSVRSMPPNQAVSIRRQLALNQRHNLTPENRDIGMLILKKSQALQRNLTDLERHQLATLDPEHNIRTGLAENLNHVDDEAVHLVMTSPPFLNVVNYRQDNWLRCWFAAIDLERIPKVTSSPSQWTAQISHALREMLRILKPGGHIALEVGEIKKGQIKLEKLVVEAGIQCELKPYEIYLHTQHFTKTSHCWGIENNTAGTNTNRIVVFKK
jgi:hypothetical protein